VNIKPESVALIWDSADVSGSLGKLRSYVESESTKAIEWGWLRAMGRQVLYFRESGFSREQADMMGLIADQFDWNEPEKHIPDAISKWLK
jgi:hypothetical protein